MIASIQWIIATEVIAVAALPFATRLWRGLPDRGYVFAKILGIVGVTYVVWIVGSVLPVAGSALLPAVVVALLGIGGWAIWRVDAVETLRSTARLIVIEEAIFLAAFVVWNLVRAFVIHPGIDHTEQFMDMAFLNAAHRSASFPPYDPWMSGHTINYYYFGYLTWATIVNLSGVAPAIGYNLALSTLFALTIAGTFSLGYALARRLTWAALGPLLVVLIGNWHAIAVQIPAGLFPWNQNYWFWDSTRVIGNAADYTINEFPFFSFMLGDLHPHVMALPVAIATLGLAVAWFVAPPGEDRAGWGHLLVGAVLIGSLFATNSWDFPTYLLVVAGALVAGRYLRDDLPDWWRPPARQAPVLAAASVILFLPSYLEVRGLTHGIGVVTTRSDLLQYLQVFGLFLAGAALLVASIGYVFQPMELSGESGSVSLRWASGAGVAGAIVMAAAAVAGIVLGAEVQVLPLAIDLALAVGAGVVLWRVLNSDDPRAGDVLALLFVLVAALILSTTELVYVRDSFDGGPSYRMNTVFKFYYQAWVLLGVATAYALFRGTAIIRRYVSRVASLAVLGLFGAGILGGLAYTFLAPQSPPHGDTTRSLDGMAWLASAAPGDYAGIQWLNNHVTGHPVVLEGIENATASTPVDYTSFSRVSTFTGLPTVMGWPGHEEQWRPGDPDIEARIQDVVTIYQTQNVATARRLLRRYHVRYVFVGTQERDLAGVTPADLAKFGRFMKVVFREDGTTIYKW
ncbi:MAG TPA: DUF2298 domain-containing protein [Chloroflexota bacterium]|nr:DUF2298 domain-containing protein [Chloroflexota bacterium]